jgi:cyclopropane fatty-acyl-phospholipid synthase-like methyltransferase
MARQCRLEGASCRDMIDKPYAPSCDRNRDPILAVLREVFADRRRVLEIGSGTGQHAVHFAAALPHLTWQCSDRDEHLPGMRLWLHEAELPNTPPPIVLDVEGAWPDARFDALFSANTLHIMGWKQVEAMFGAMPRVLADDAIVVIYGPFKVGGRHTSESNETFDASLRAKAPHQGVRDVADVDALARRAGLVRIDDRPMPANNRCLVWRRAGSTQPSDTLR